MTDEQTQTVDDLLRRINELEKQNKEYLEGWQRMKADVQNRERDIQSERSKLVSMIHEDTAIELLPVLDAFSAAFNATSWQNVDENWRKGVEYIFQQLRSVLEGKGITSFGVVGDIYDPHLHDLSEEITIDTDQMLTVAKVIRPGYKIHDRVIRPATVSLQ